MAGTDYRGREFEIAANVAELLDTLKPEQQRQVMTMLLTRYDCWPNSARQPLKKRPFRPSPKRR